MGFLDDNSDIRNRIIEESVPGKQVTIAHVIASPMHDIYERLGIEEAGAIGILTLSPYETAIIAADIAVKDRPCGGHRYTEEYAGIHRCADHQNVVRSIGWRRE